MKKFLVIAPSWIGDLIISQSLFTKLRDLHPDCIIDVVAPSWCQPLLSLMPEVNESITLPFRHGEFNWFGRRKIGKQLRGNHYDQAFILPNSWKSALIPFFAGIPKRTGYLGEMRYGLLNDIHHLNTTKHPTLAERFVALVGSDNQPPKPRLHLPSEILIENLALVSQKVGIYLDPIWEKQLKVIGLCPGAEYGPAKRWPIAYYTELCTSLLEKGFAVWLFGSKNDMEVTDVIANKIYHPYFFNFAGQTTLIQATSLLSLTHLVVTNDSGLMHVAASLGKEIIALYGSTDPNYTPPLADKAQIITADISCRPCFKRECPYGHYNCLKQITPAQVLELCHA